MTSVHESDIYMDIKLHKEITKKGTNRMMFGVAFGSPHYMLTTSKNNIFQ